MVSSQRTPVSSTRPGVLICLDAGHGGKDPGCASTDREYHEKNLTLATALMTQRHLQNLGYQVMLTRSDDTFVPLDQRAAIANEANATFFVSIHYNAVAEGKQSVEGVEVYCFDKGPTDEPSEACALAHRVLEQVTTHTKAPSRGVKEANFAVLRLTTMPAVLIEGGFLTNDSECERLSTPRYLNAIAWGITQGIHDQIAAATKP